MYKTLLTAATTGLQNQALFNGLQATEQVHTLKNWSESVDISTSDSLQSGIVLSMDAQLIAEFPTGWTEERSELDFQQDFRFKLGGWQYFYFLTEYFTFEIYVNIVPFVYVFMNNTFFLETNEWTHCDHMYKGYEIMKVRGDVDIGFKKCESSLWDIAFEDEAENYSCAIDKESLEKLYYNIFGDYKYEMFGYDSCDRNIFFQKPAKEVADVLEDTIVEDIDENLEEEF